MNQASNPGSDGTTRDGDLDAMGRAMALAASVRTRTSPNPWVGCVVVADDDLFEGATEPPGGAHAEVVALEAAGDRAKGSTLYSTLEPCVHAGRTPPCTDAITRAGVSRVVIGVLDPDEQVRGRGAAALEAAGIAVEVGVAAEQVAEQLAPYMRHRLTGRPYVVLKLAATMDGRIASPQGDARWITGDAARADAHRLRAESDAILVGAGTVRADDPELTVRLGDSTDGDRNGRQPLRVVLGRAPDDAKVHPALQMDGDLGAVLDELGGKGVLQLLVEGGATVAHAFHRAGLVDRYVLYLSPSLFGGDDAVPMFAGPGASSMAELWRGRLLAITPLGDDLRVDLGPRTPDTEAA